MKPVFALTAALVLPALAGPALAAPVPLAPHRAVYDLKLAGERLAMSDGGTAMTGRMVYEFTGGACEGFTVNFRFVVETTDSEGARSVTDLRTATHEETDGSAFQFLSQTYTDRILTEDVKGTATRGDGAVTVDLDNGETRSITLDGNPVFPTDHLQRIVDAARDGRRMLEQDVFDGSDGGDRVYRTATFIGPEIDRPAAAVEAPFAGLRRWPVTVSYFDPAAGGDQVPDYSIGFSLWENGVSSDLRMDYGDFALDGALASYEPLPAADCE